MMRLFLLHIILMVISSPLAYAQAPEHKICYDSLLKEGRKALESKAYKLAINKFITARSCPDKPTEDHLDNFIEDALEIWTKELNDAKKQAEFDNVKIQANTDALLKKQKELENKQKELEEILKDNQRLSNEQQVRDSIQSAIDLANQLANFSLNNSIPSEKSFLAITAYQLFNGYTSKNNYPSEVYTAIYDALDKQEEGYNTLANLATYGSIRDFIILDDFLVNASEGGMIQVINLENGRWKQRYFHDFVNRTVSISPNTKKVAIGGNAYYTYILDLENNFKLDTINIHHNKLTWDLQFINDSTLLSLGGNGMFIEYNLNTRREKKIHEMENINSNARSFVMNLKNELLVYIDDGELVFAPFRATEANTRIIRQLKKISSDLRDKDKNISISDIAFSKDNQYIFLGTSKGETILLDLNVDDFNPSFFNDHRKKIQQVLISDDSKFFASVSTNGIVITKNEKEHNNFFIPSNNSWFRKAAFNPSSSRIYIGDNKGHLKWWDLNIKELKNKLCPYVVKNKQNVLQTMHDKYIGIKYKKLNPCGISY